MMQNTPEHMEVYTGKRVEYAGLRYDLLSGCDEIRVNRYH